MSRFGALTGAGREALFVAVDDGGAPSQTGVIILPPFGWEEVCSYRPRREWARHLGGERRLALRLQFPGTGDSAGTPHDGDRLAAWTRAAGDAVAWVRAQPGIERVAVIGLGLGGFVGWLAAADGATVDDLVLWGTPARGTRLLRELRAFAALQASKRGLPAPAPDTELEIAGYVLSMETQAALATVDLTEHVLPSPGARRVLLLDRDGLAPDPQLQDHLARTQVSSGVAPGPGWGQMTAEPQAATAPLSTIAIVSAWLAEVGAPSALPSRPSPVELVSMLSPDAARSTTRETPVTIGHHGHDLEGVLCSGGEHVRAPVSMLLLNAGAINRQGPNRIWVEAARRWAQRGVTSLRLDVEGIGEAGGAEGADASDAGLYVPRLVDQALEGVQRLDQAAPGADIVVIGLCSGAYWGFQAALRGAGLRSVVMLNPRVLFWRDELGQEHDAWLVRRVIFSLDSWRRVAHRQVSGVSVRIAVRMAAAAAAFRLHRLLGGRRAGMSTDERITEALDRLRDSGVRVTVAFSEREPLHHELTAGGQLAQLARWPQLQVDALPGAVHTLQSLEAQAAAHAIIDREVERAIERAGA